MYKTLTVIAVLILSWQYVVKPVGIRYIADETYKEDVAIADDMYPKRPTEEVMNYTKEETIEYIAELTHRRDIEIDRVRAYRYARTGVHPDDQLPEFAYGSDTILIIGKQALIDALTDTLEYKEIFGS